MCEQLIKTLPLAVLVPLAYVCHMIKSTVKGESGRAEHRPLVESSGLSFTDDTLLLYLSIFFFKHRQLPSNLPKAKLHPQAAAACTGALAVVHKEQS